MSVSGVKVRVKARSYDLKLRVGARVLSLVPA